MCGIVAYWAKESLLTRRQYDILFEGAARRGNDGVGLSILFPDNARFFPMNKKWMGSYKDNKEGVLDYVVENMGVGLLLLASFRATPETECKTSYNMIQPIGRENLWLIHNGGVTDSVKESLDFDYQTPLDSEAIIASYLIHGRNMQSAMEYLSGSFAFVLFDRIKDMLYAVTSFLPLAHAYIRGCGYFIHSDNECLSRVLKSLIGVDRDGVNVWESWYHHDLDGYSIYETDLTTGFQSKRSYKPRFLHPMWDSISAEGKRKKTFVVASGGIDSGLTTFLLHKAGYDVSMLHFSYGQKSEAAERWAVHELSSLYGIPYQPINLRLLYHEIVDPSMLLEKNIKITSGGDDIKSTIAWVAGRNAIFASIAMAFAETAILNYNYEHVFLAAGWNQLSEETGGYPDNSYKFNKALEELKRYGYITGHRISFLPVLRNLTKTECWKLGGALGFPFEKTVSCDDPEMYRGVPALCIDCGSTKLSMIASDRAGVHDSRLFKGSAGIGFRKPEHEPMDLADPCDLIDRLIIDNDSMEKLKDLYLRK